jgi:nucleoside-diphosphate-sugar epimerase
MAERLLLTGATGFVGRALAAPLAARGFEVHALSHSLPRDAGEGWGGGGGAPATTRWHQADLFSEADAAALLRDVRPTRLVHAAWYVVHGKFWTAPENAAWVEASEALARRFLEAGGRRFVGLGTCVEYADRDGDDDAPWPETRALAPTTPYGQAKVDLAARLSRIEGLSVAWARIFHLFGAGENPQRLVPSVALALLRGEEARTGSGRPVRDFASTRFVGEAIAALAASQVTGPVNIGSGEGRAIAEVVRFIAEAAGRPDLLRLGALPDRPGEVPRMVADVTRLRREVGFDSPARVEEDLRALLAGLRP